MLDFSIFCDNSISQQGSFEPIPAVKIDGPLYLLEKGHLKGIGNNFIEIVLDTASPAIISLRINATGNSGLSHNLLFPFVLKEPKVKNFPILELKKDYFFHPIAGGGSFSIDPSGKHFFSGDSLAHQTICDLNHSVAYVYITDISCGNTIQNWHFSLSKESPELIWKISFSNLADQNLLFFLTFSSDAKNNPVFNSIWLEDLVGDNRLSRTLRKKFQTHYPFASNSEFLTRKAGACVVTNLYAPFDTKGDLMLTTDGYLTRQELFGKFSRLGVIPDRASNSVEMKISPLLPLANGLQLDFSLPDKQIEHDLKNFYDQIVNAAVLADPVLPSFGNETSGYYFLLTAYTYAYLLSFGVLSSDHSCKDNIDPLRAFGNYLKYLAENQNEAGFFTAGGLPGIAEDNEPSFVIALHKYIFTTGNRELAMKILPIAEKAMNYCLENSINHQDLIHSGSLIVPGFNPSNTYWDTLRWSGKIAFTNALFFQALKDIAELEEFLGFKEKAIFYRSISERVKKAFNEHFWDEKLFHSGGYYDWIDDQGKKYGHLYTAPHLLAIVFGIADKEKSVKIFKSIDHRLKFLAKNYQWCQWGIPSNLYDAIEDVKPIFAKDGTHTFGNYMNGGIFPEWTAWEIIARCKAGQPNVALYRVQKFMEHYRRRHFLEGTNCWDIKGNPHQWVEEPYLSTQALICITPFMGFLGIEPSLSNLQHHPYIPYKWKEIRAKFNYMGNPTEITVTNRGYHPYLPLLVYILIITFILGIALIIIGKKLESAGIIGN